MQQNISPLHSHQAHNAVPSTFDAYLHHLRTRHQKSLCSLQQATGYSRQYLRMLETGARTQPSPRFLKALSQALPLTLQEQQQLYVLAGYAAPEPHPQPLESAQISVFLQQFVLQNPAPTVLHDSLWRVQAASPLMHNLLTLAGMGPEVTLVEALYRLRERGRVHDWDSWIRFMLSHFKLDSLSLHGTPAYHQQLQRLALQPGFRELWSRIDPSLEDTPSMPVHYTLQSGPTVHFEVVRLKVVSEPFWVVSFMPRDEGTRVFLQHLLH